MKVVELTATKNSIEQLLKDGCDKNFPSLKIECSLLNKPSKMCNKNGACYQKYIFERKYSGSQSKVISLSKPDEVVYSVFNLSLKDKYLVIDSINQEVLDGLVIY